MIFVDRADAGRRLGRRLHKLRGCDVVVLGLPRGGVPVAFEVARDLAAPLDVILVRKLGVPRFPELAMGAIAENGVRILNEDTIRACEVSAADIALTQRREEEEMRRQAARLRAGRSRIDLTGRTAVIVDDGIATGATARVACHVARAHGAGRVVLAVPVAPPETVMNLGDAVDEVVCLQAPQGFCAVGLWYEHFGQVQDAEVAALLDAAARHVPPWVNAG